MSSRPRLASVLAFVSVSIWLASLLIGFHYGGFIHLLLLVAAVVFPWRAAAAEDPDQSEFRSRSTSAGRRSAHKR